MNHALSAKYNRILLIRTDRIGDMMVSTPCFRALRARFPQARIDVLASRLNEIAVQGNPHIDHVYVFDRKAFWTWPGLCWQLRANRYDCCLVISSASRTTCALMLSLGIPVRIGFDTRKGCEKLFTSILPPSDEPHVILWHLERLRALGIENASPDMNFTVPANLREAFAKRFPRTPGRLRIALFIGNIKKVQNRWPAEKFVQLISELAADPNLELVIFSGESDTPLLTHFELFANAPRISVFVGTSFQESGAFLLQCDALVCGSTGPTHLATALGVPVLSVITRYNVRSWRPLGPDDQWVAPPDDIEDMRSIPVEPVLAMIREFVQKKTVGYPAASEKSLFAPGTITS